MGGGERNGMMNLKEELQSVLNRHCAENESNTPVFILATFLLECLTTFDIAIKARDRWYNVHLAPADSYFRKQ